MKNNILLNLVFISYFLSACTSATVVNPSDSSPKNSVVPTPSSDTIATVTGVLMVNQQDPMPASRVILVLAEVMESKGTPVVAGFDRMVAPNTLTDHTGQFIFTDVKPGRYALVLDKITEAMLLNDPTSGGDLLFSVEGGKVTDIGRLIYRDLPIFTPTP
jgi:hypothetical protein